MTLRARLTLALLALALVPTALYTAFTLDQLGRSADRWFRPGVNRALESALEVTRTTLARVEAVALAQSDALAEQFPAGPLADHDRDRLRVALRAAGLDFIQVYRRAAGRWQLLEQLAPPGVIAIDRPDLGPEIEPSIGASRVIHSARGAIAAVASVNGDRALITGIWVAPDFFARVDDVGLGVSRYGQLGVLVKLQRQYLWFLVSLVVVALVAVALVLASSLARGLSRPLREVARAFERVAGGDLGTRIRPAGAREVRTLGESFNVMTARLEAARDSLKQAEREAAWREVARRLAHEFKNILTPMSLSLHRLAARAEAVEPSQRAAVRDSLGLLDRGVGQLGRLAEQFSQYARLPDPAFEPLDLTEVARAAAGMEEPEVTSLEIHPGPPLPVRGDSLLLSRAIHNLLVNAREASPPGERVELRTFAAGSQAVLEILDRGSGVPEAVRDRVFEPYVSTKQRSSGLGLSLVRDITTQHGGTVTLENRQGGGACARLALPLAPAAAGAPKGTA
ncbi:MAG: HAMP domain-containing protein [Candidatus Eisenbacteria bacterium]|uniref:Signal transduction histidine-protein kinase/phosphatase MprB n=1 Tax=Eiseniibacteriota bacterium TaxID=2212470 RepID=A0A538STD6_UNCEI|nr:MAG: HAMP domain-containing protein [Candidatus Eisenbacteria bacterium]